MLYNLYNTVKQEESFMVKGVRTSREKREEERAPW